MGTLLDKPVTEKEHTESGTAHNLHYGVSSMQGWRVDMEDAHLFVGDLDPAAEGTSLFGVFDGHGGEFAAKYAADKSAGVAATLREEEDYKSYVSLPPESRASKQGIDLLSSALQSAFIAVDKSMLSTPTMSSSKDRSGCTAVVVVVTPTHVLCANAGDSRACAAKVVDGRVTEVPLSEDHKPYNPGER